MRTTTTKLFILSLLISTTLLAARSVYATPLYFPHIATVDSWQTEIAIINTSGQIVTGTLQAFSDSGQLVDTEVVTLASHGRRQIAVANEFTNHTSIGYIIFDTNSAAIQGYTKFYQEGRYRVAIPAVKEINTSNIYVAHIASNAEWWTGISLVNTTTTAKTLTINFSDGRSKPVTLAANEHRAFAVKELFNNQPQPSIESAVIMNASGIIGLELFATYNGKQMEGILLTDKTASSLYYPYVVNNAIWWTGVVAYNPSSSPCDITVTSYTANGTYLSSTTRSISGMQKYIGTVDQLGLPAETSWFKIDSTRALSGFELIGTRDLERLSSYAGNGGTGSKTGVFAKIEKDGGGTVIVLINTENNAASVTLTAYTDAGTAVASKVVTLESHFEMISAFGNIFLEDISNATYIGYSSNRNMVGMQLNSSADSTMLDGLPCMPGPGVGNPPEASAMIGAAGGKVEVTNASSPLYGVKVEIPPAALGVNTTITISQASKEPSPPSKANRIGRTISFGPEGTMFDLPVSITIPYATGSFDESSLQIYEYNGSSWSAVTSGALDLINNTVTALTEHFSEYAVLAPKNNATATGTFDRADCGFPIKNENVCAGMTTYALWFFEHVKCPLNRAYEASVAAEVARAAHDALDPWNKINRDDTMDQYLSHESGSTVNDLINALKAGGPQILLLSSYKKGSGEATVDHYILVYNYNGTTFDIFDPNYLTSRKLTVSDGKLTDPDYSIDQKYLIFTSRLYNRDTSALMEAIFRKYPFNVAGSWTVTETVTGTCTWQGESSTETSTATAPLNIVQNGSSVNWTTVVNPYPMTGTVTGNKIHMWGRANIMSFPGSVTSNIYNASGTICGDNIQMIGLGMITGSYDGYGFTCMLYNTLNFNR